MKKTLVIFILVSFCGLYAFAQSAVVSSGNSFSGSDCSVSYTVGQIGYNDYSRNMLFNEGVQQPYEIYDITDETVAMQGENSAQRGTLDVEETARSISLSAYPNPTDDFLNLVVEGDDLGAMKCTVYDVSGRQISERNIFTGETRLDMGGLPPATYFVRVTEGNELLRTFKVVKK